MKISNQYLVKFLKKKEQSSDDVEKGNTADTPKIQPFLASFRNIFEKIVRFLRKKTIRYPISFLLAAFVIYLYVVFESNRNITPVKVLFFFIPTTLIVPLGLILALIAVLYLSWDDAFFKKYRTPALYMIALTAIFYSLIFTGLSEYLFQTSLAKWLTKFTAILVVATLKLFGFDVVDAIWNEERVLTTITINSSEGVKAIGINAACSGIHSLTVFAAIFILMLFESRKRLHWPNKNQKLGANVLTTLVIFSITALGILGTYLLNLFRVGFILALYYDLNWTQLEPIHNYMGYVILILWLPVYWLFILPIAEKPELKLERKERRKEKKLERVKKRQEKANKQDIQSDYLKPE